METFISLVFDLLALLVDTYKINLKNGRLMAFMAILIISLQTMLYLFNVFSVAPWFTDLVTRQTYQLLVASPGSPEFTNLLINMQKDLKLFVVEEWIFLLISAFASLFLAISTTYASALIHGGKKITSIKHLVLWTFRSLKRPLVTSFYITLFIFGYLTFSLFTLLPFALFLGGDQIIMSKVSAYLLAILATIFYAYLSVVWKLSLVVSILEEKSGIEALGKSAQIVKGMKLQGILLNLLVAIVSVILIKCLRLDKLKQAEAVQIVISMVVVSLMSMVQMFVYTAYTVLYYGCKKSHGEEVEFQAADMEMEYTNLPIDAPLVNENIPCRLMKIESGN